MGFKALTVNTPVDEEAHILAEDDATLYGAVIGGDCVLPVGSQFPASVTSNNNVRIGDGMLIVGGHVGRIVKYDYEDMTIANGVSGQNRNDLIVARFISGGTAGADDFRLVVVQGTPGATAKDPATVQGDLYNGDVQRDYPLWRVRLTGLSVAGVDKMFTVGRMLADKLDKTGNASNVTNTFTQATARNQLTSGEKLSVSLGKIMKFFADIKTGAFHTVVNNLTTTVEGHALDARQGKALNDAKLDKTGNASNVTNTFTQATARNQLTSGEKLSVSLGKIMKFFADIKTGAFHTVVNNLTTTAAGYALDARQGKTLNDRYGSLNSALNSRANMACAYWGPKLKINMTNGTGIIIIGTSSISTFCILGNTGAKELHYQTIHSNLSSPIKPYIVFNESEKSLTIRPQNNSTAVNDNILVIGYWGV